MPGYEEGGYGGFPGMSGGQQNTNALSNIASGVSRPDSFSSVGAVKALLYADTVSVVHFNLNRIDYEGLSSYLDELVDKGAGSIQSDDKYRVELREYQKKQLKSSFKRLLSTIQNATVKLLFKNKIDEYYVISYANSDSQIMGATIVAIPTEGLKDAEIKSALDSFAKEEKPITIFERYGFIIGVIKHDAEKPLDVSAIDARYKSKLAQSQVSAYGSYSSQPNGNRNASGSGSFGGSNSNAAQTLKDYAKEISDAQDRNRAESRREVLPRVRNRFENPATEKESEAYARGLALADGAAIAYVATKPENLLSAFNSDSDDSASSPFAGLGLKSAPKNSDDSFDDNDVVGSLKDTVQKGIPSSDLSYVSIAISLVGSPRLVAFLGYKNEGDATNNAKAIDAVLKASKLIAQSGVQKAIQESGLDASKINLNPIVNAVFDGLAPKVSGSDVALVLDLEPIKANAAVLVPLLGGVETKSSQEMESDTIDWSLGDKEKTDKSDRSDDDSDDLFDDEKQDKNDNSEDEDDPFA